MLYDGEEFEHNGHTFRVEFPYDDDNTPPWKREDGHGPVDRRRCSPYSDPTKAPGEMILWRDRGEMLVYDFSEAVKIARRDGWWFPGMTQENCETMKPGEIAHKSALADFDRLRRWCDDQWQYVGVVVTMLDEDGEGSDYSESIWGVESDSEEWLEATARELADECLARYRDDVDEEETATARNMEESRPDMYGARE